MNIRPVQNQTSFKAYTSNDIYRLEQKIDQLQAQLDDGSLHDFYKDLPKSRRLPMPLGVPPYAMAGMPAPSYTMGPMGMPPMGMPPMGPMGPIGMPPVGAYHSPGTPLSPMAMNPITLPPSRLSGQPPVDMYSSRK